MTYYLICFTHSKILDIVHFEDFDQLMNFINVKGKSLMYQETIMVSIIIVIFNKLNIPNQVSNEVRRINILMLNTKDIENEEYYARYISSLLNKEKPKCISLKEKTLARAESHIKSANRYVCVCECPNFIKLNKNSQLKYNRFIKMFDIMSMISK